MAVIFNPLLRGSFELLGRKADLDDTHGSNDSRLGKALAQRCSDTPIWIVSKAAGAEASGGGLSSPSASVTGQFGSPTDTLAVPISSGGESLAMGGRRVAWEDRWGHPVGEPPKGIGLQTLSGSAAKTYVR